MRDVEFNEFMREFYEEAQATQKVASQEYAQNDDKFANFKMIADIMQYRPHLRGIITPEDVAWIYRFKHILSQLKGVSLREGMRGRRIDDNVYGVIIAGMEEETLTTNRTIKPHATNVSTPFSAREREAAEFHTAGVRREVSVD